MSLKNTEENQNDGITTQELLDAVNELQLEIKINQSVSSSPTSIKGLP